MMVRNYKRKSNTEKWNEKEEMKAAIEDVNSGLTIYAAAKKYDIPEATLRRHIRRSDIRSVGRPTTLPPEVEIEIIETCQIFAEWGFGLTKVNIINVVGDYFRHTKKPNPFKNGVPGNDWWQLFMKRHPEVSKRKPQALQMVGQRQQHLRWLTIGSTIV